MKKQNVFFKVTHSFLTFLCLCLVSCSTPSSVRLLSEQTGATVSVLSDSLDSFVQGRTEIAKARARISADYAQVLADREARAENRIASMKLADDDSLKKVEEVIKASEEQAKVEWSRLHKAELFEKEMVATQKKLGAPVDQLNELSKMVAGLGKDQDFKKQLAFYAGYISTVYSDMKDLQKQEKAALGEISLK